MAYLLNTTLQQDEMLKVLGLSSLEELYKDFPNELKIKGLNIPKGIGEQAVLRKFTEFASKNTVYPTIFRGAGAYRHYIPAVVPEMVNKERFKTAYTPYQAEVSQGVLQSIFEFQSMICELTGLDVSNASVYDGATAAAEASAMCKERKRERTLILENVNPLIIDTVNTYSWAADSPVDIISAKDGLTDIEALQKALKSTDDVASVLVQQPNYFGLIEDIAAIAEVCHAAKAKLIVSINPIASAVLASMGECGVDIVVGEGQPLGIPLSFGGPYLGFMAATNALMRRMPGRIAGQTTDEQGRRAFVLTLQAREQHIRRETAGSNICSNQALCAITAACYMASMGSAGMTDVATLCYNKAHHLANELVNIGFELKYDGDFFHEFITTCPVDVNNLMQKLEGDGILGGLPLKDGSILWCATEMNTKDEIEKLVSIIKEVK